MRSRSNSRLRSRSGSPVKLRRSRGQSPAKSESNEFTVGQFNKLVRDVPFQGIPKRKNLYLIN